MRKLFVLFLLLTAVLWAEGNSRKGSEDYTVEKIGEEQLTDLLSDRNGKPLFLNMWATWCIPCREEMPDIVELSEEYGDKIDFVGISIDYPKEIESKIIPFMKEHNVGFKMYVNNFSKDEKLITMLNKDWVGSLPATFIYTPDGKQAAFLEGLKSKEEFLKEIKKVLK